MEICFIIASYLSLICLITASYMRHGWIWWRILDTAIYRDAVVVQQRPAVGCNHISPHSCSNNIPSLVCSVVTITAHWQSSFQTPRSRTTAERSNFKRPILTVKWTQRWVLLRNVEMFISPVVCCVAESGGSASLWTAGSQDTTEDKAGGITNTGAA